MCAVPEFSIDVFSAVKESLSSVQAVEDVETIVNLLAIPPKFTTLRINFLKESKENVKVKLLEFLKKQCKDLEGAFVPMVYEHDQLFDLLVIPSYGPLNQLQFPFEVIVDALCGAAVLRGADVFVPGILGAPQNLQAGDSVSVYADLDGRCKKGLMLPYEGRKHFVGNGVVMYSRHDIFRSQTPLTGIGVRMSSPLYWSPSLSGLLPETLYAQNLPSALTSHVLGPQPGEVVLDMCAAPGGKTTHIATLMKNRGRVVALDKGSRVDRVSAAAQSWRLGIVEAYSFNSTRACGGGAEISGAPPYPAGSFDRVLLDAPCSALGQRPCLRRVDTAKALASHVVCQRSLLEVAARLVKPGGTLVYSTCTLLRAECEEQVVWLLRKFPDLKLAEQSPQLGKPGLPSPGLGLEERQLLQRFYPGPRDTDRGLCMEANCTDDFAEIHTDSDVSASRGCFSKAFSVVDTENRRGSCQIDKVDSCQVDKVDCCASHSLSIHSDRSSNAETTSNVRIDASSTTATEVEGGTTLPLILACNSDTIGFFIAKFYKLSS